MIKLLSLLVALPTATIAFAADIPVASPANVATPAAATARAALPPPAVAKPIVVTANKDQKAPWNGEKIVCTREAPIGSMIAVRHCTTKSVDEQNQRDAREVLGRPIAGMGGPQ